MNTLILFSKEPIEGEVKTRLIPVLGKKGAYLLYCQLLKLMLKRFSTFSSIKDSTNFVIYTNFKKPNSGKPNSKSFFKNYANIKKQIGNDLGEKMFNALAQELHIPKIESYKDGICKQRDSIQSKKSKVLLFGADCPFLTKKIIQNAFDSLDNYDSVFVPTDDGGYVLIGATKICPEIFYNIKWSTPEVMQKTQENLKQINYSYQLLETLSDIDEPKDLKLLPALNCRVNR